jgi:hypothetical protein
VVRPKQPTRQKDASVHVQLALSSVACASEIERQLIKALALRSQKPLPVALQEFKRWDDAYATKMRLVHTSFPDDQDVMALLIEALMVHTARRLWDIRIGTPASNSNVIEALDICDKSFRLVDRNSVAQHPAVLYLNIHLLEMSPFPEQGIISTNLLSDMCPDAEHINHVLVRFDRWQDIIDEPMVEDPGSVFTDSNNAALC